MPGLQRGLEDVVFVRVHRALHDVLAQAVGGVDEHYVAEARLGIEREDDAAGREVGAHHLLHTDAESDLEVVEAFIDAIADGAVGEERGKTALATIEHREMAADVQVSLVLPGHAGVRQVLRRRAAAHGHVGGMQRAALKRIVGGEDFRFEVARQLGGENGVTNLRAALPEVLHVARIESLEDVANLRVQSRLAQKIAKPVGGDGKAIRHLHTLGRQLAEHLAQRSVLPADQRHVVDADVSEPFDEAWRDARGRFRSYGASGRARRSERRRALRRFGFRGIRCGGHKLSSFR